MSMRTSTYCDMGKFRKSRERYKANYRNRTGSGKYGKHAWTNAELDMVLAHEITDRELSEKIGRSVAAIQIMRSKLKKQEVTE